MGNGIDIRDLIGKEFVKGGRTVADGLDCWGLTMEVYRRYGITIPDFVVDAFGFQAINALAGRAVESRVWEEVHCPTDADIPLVVLMRMHPILITHAGVLIQRDKIIHTTAGTGVIMSKASALESRIAGYYRYVKDN